MQFALVPFNPVVGEVAGNAHRMLAFCDHAADLGCGLIVFPELSLVGYPPRDLLFYEVIHRQQGEALRWLKERSKRLAIVCGGVLKNRAPGQPFFNAALVFQNGRQHSYAKRLLPNYDVFDESRYFEPGEKPLVLKLGDRRLGVTVCEDIWGSEPQLKRRYAQDIVAEYARKRVDALINISASPFETGKPERRHALLARVARQHHVGILYVNQVGGNDDLVFDGGACAYDFRGRVVMRSKSFAEGLFVYDDTAGSGANVGSSTGEGAKADAGIAVLPEGYAALHDALVLGLRDYVRKTGHERVVLGLSGGMDSALVAALATRALRPENVLGVMLPSRYSSPGSLADAQALAENLGIATQTIPIEKVHRCFEAAFAQMFGNNGARDLTGQNIQARIRGNLLMAISNNEGRLLLNTTNKSEMATGYGTLYGDMCGALAVISDLTKTQVYELGRFINRERAVIPTAVFTKPPSAELKPGQKDTDTLPPYDILDPWLSELIDRQRLGRGGVGELPPKIARQVLQAEYKRRQAPIGLKVSDKAFGSGRRFPIAARVEV